MSSRTKKYLLWALFLIVFATVVWKKQTTSNVSPEQKSFENSQPNNPVTAQEPPAEVPPVDTAEKHGSSSRATLPENSNIKDFPKPVVKAAQPLTEAQIQFDVLVERVKRELPNQRELQNLPAEQTHYTPEIVHKAALAIGEVAQAMADNITVRPQGLKFYRECAENDSNLNSIRAGCFHNYQELLQKDSTLGPSLENDPAVSPSVKALAKKISE